MRRSIVAVTVMAACAFACSASAATREGRVRVAPFSATMESPEPATTTSIFNSCRGAIDLSYPQAPGDIGVGDIVRVSIGLGAGLIRGGTELSLNRVRFFLDCDSSSRGFACRDDGPVVSYQGGLTTDCGVTFVADHAPGDLFPNVVTFTPTTSVSLLANVRSACTLEFNVRIESPSEDDTTNLVEQLAGFDTSLNDGVCNTAPPLTASGWDSGQICLGPDCETLGTPCEPLLDLSYLDAANLIEVGSTVRARITFGGGRTGQSVPIVVQRLRFDLDCNNTNVGINCPDDGGVVSYQGNLTTTCPVGFEADHAPGDTLPNQIVFAPAVPLVVPAQTPNFCDLDFDFRLESRSNDLTPDTVEQAYGIDASLDDAVCEVSGRARAAEDTSGGALQFCPVCDDGDQCNGLETCDGITGCVPGTPLVCDDHNVCTDDGCDPTIYGGDPCVFRDIGSTCDDHDACTDDACDPQLGCTHASSASRCDDGNVCTSDACDPASGCVFSPNGSCAESPKGLGYWKRLCRGEHPSGEFFVPEDVACVAAACPFEDVQSTDDLCARLLPAHPNNACEKAEAQLLALELNVCRGRVSDDATFHPSCGSPTTIGEARARAEAALCEPSRTPASCRAASCTAQ